MMNALQCWNGFTCQDPEHVMRSFPHQISGGQQHGLDAGILENAGQVREASALFRAFPTPRSPRPRPHHTKS